MEELKDVKVSFANLTYSFMKFQEQYKTLCQEVSEEETRNLLRSVKKVRSFIYEYLPFIRGKEVHRSIIHYMDKVQKEISEDSEYEKLSQEKNPNTKQNIRHRQLYYIYLIKVYRVIGLFGDKLSETFMPNKNDRAKFLRYYNGNYFFEQFTYYKSETAKKLGVFSIYKFKEGFTYLLGFYFAYYLFIDEKSRRLCEKVFSNILTIYLQDKVVGNLISSFDKLPESQKEFLKGIDYKIHNALSNVFFRCNYSYSQYNVLPKIEKRVAIDRTTI